MARKPWRLARWTLSFVLMTTGLLTAEMIAQEAATPPLVAAAGTWSGGSDPGAGSRPWQPVKSIQLDAWLSVGVNVYNGNLMLTTKALQMPGVDGFDLDIDPLYNDLNRSYVTDMGKGWSMDTGRDVGLDLSSPTKPVFHDPSGATYTFTQSVCGSSCTYTSPPGIDAVLGYDGTSYGLTYNASGDSYFFNTNGYLTATGNRAGKRIAFSYDSSGRLSQIVNTEGQGATFTYNAQNQIATIYYGGAATATIAPGPTLKMSLSGSLP